MVLSSPNATGVGVAVVPVEVEGVPVDVTPLLSQAQRAKIIESARTSIIILLFILSNLSFCIKEIYPAKQAPQDILISFMVNYSSSVVVAGAGVAVAVGVAEGVGVGVTTSSVTVHPSPINSETSALITRSLMATSSTCL